MIGGNGSIQHRTHLAEDLGRSRERTCYRPGQANAKRLDQSLDLVFSGVGGGRLRFREQRLASYPSSAS